MQMIPHALCTQLHFHQEGQDDLQFWGALGAFHQFSKVISLPLRPLLLDPFQVSTMLHCRMRAFPFNYLDLPFKTTSLSKRDWQPLLNRIEKRLVTWKGHSLSRGGRLILVNSVLISLPPYFMSFFFLQQWSIDQVEQLKHAFFWKGKRSVTGWQCLISWDVLCSPHGSSGLGIQRLIKRL